MFEIESWFLDVSTHGEDDRKLLADFMNKGVSSYVVVMILLRMK